MRLLNTVKVSYHSLFQADSDKIHGFWVHKNLISPDVHYQRLCDETFSLMR